MLETFCRSCGSEIHLDIDYAWRVIGGTDPLLETTCDMCGDTLRLNVQFILENAEALGVLQRDNPTEWELICDCCGRGLTVDRLEDAGKLATLAGWRLSVTENDWNHADLCPNCHQTQTERN